MKYYLMMDSLKWKQKYNILSANGHKSYVLDYACEKTMEYKIGLAYSSGTSIGEAKFKKRGMTPKFDFMMKNKKEGEIFRKIRPGAPKISILDGTYQVSGNLKKEEYLLSSGDTNVLKAYPEVYREQKVLCIEVLNTLETEKNLLILAVLIALNHLETF